MARKVTFGLGPAPAILNARNLVIKRFPDAHNNDYNPVHSADAGATALSVTVELPDNRMWQAVLTDVLDSGESSTPDVLNFHTGELQFPGPKTGDRLCIIAMEDMSSSSSASSSSSSRSSLSSISTSGSSSSSSASSSSSSSSSSRSSQSTSSSSRSSLSISTSSNSSSSSSSSVSSSSLSSSSASSSSSSLSS